MAGEYGIDRQIFLPEIPEIENWKLREYLRLQREALMAAYDDLAKRMNEFSYEAQWGSSTPSQITSNQNDYDPGVAIVHRISSDANGREITGVQAPLIEMIRTWINVGSNTIIFPHQDSGSAAANRIITPDGSDLTLHAGRSVMMFYDLTTARWRIFPFVFTSSGVPVGGGNVVTAYKANDTARTTTTTMTDDPDLLIPIGANEVWTAHAVITVTVASATPDLKSQFAGPAGSSGHYVEPYNINDDKALGTHNVFGMTDFAIFVFDINIQNGATAGNLSFQWSQDTSSADATTVKAGSNIVAVQLA